MLFLSDQEKTEWKEMLEEILSGSKNIEKFTGKIRKNLLPVFQYYTGSTLIAKGHKEEGMKWLRAGTMYEEEGIFSNAFLLGFLSRHNQELIPPAVCFADPAPFIYWANMPVMKKSRENFIKQCVDSMPHFKKPFRIMDIGCGDGALTLQILKKLLEKGKINEIDEILLIDSSTGMIEIAEKTLSKDFPPSIIKTINSRIEDCSEKISSRYDLAISSLAYHHMQIEKKKIHLEKLKTKFDHFVIFELNANNDTPELHSPELALSIYQSYGRIIDFVFSCDSPVELSQACVDSFLMTESVSFLTQPRGVRSDYHMLRTQWHELFCETLGSDFTCCSDSTAYADEFLDLFTLHYGRV
jgi:SAM-dependent methyltransferase